MAQLTLLINSISQAAYPSFSALANDGKQMELMKQYGKLQEILCFALVPVLFFVLFFAKFLFIFMFDIEIAGILLLPTICLIVSTYMYGTLVLPHIVALSLGNPGIAVKQNFYGIFVVLPITILLIYFFGLTGAAVSKIVYYGFAYFYSVRRICFECFKSLPKLWYKEVIKPISLSVITYVTPLLVLTFLKIELLLVQIIVYFCTTIAFSIGTYFIVSEENRKLISRLGNKLKIF